MPERCEDDPLPGLTIVVSRPETTKAYVMRGGAECVFVVGITNDSYVPLEMQKFECHFPWPTRLIWLMDPRIHRPEKQEYRLPQSGREFRCKMVLNPPTGRAGSINPGDSLECIFLAFRRCQRFPDECFAGPVIPAELSIVDQHRREHVSEIEVTVDRTAIINSLNRRSVAAEISPDMPDERAMPTRPRYQEVPKNCS